MMVSARRSGFTLLELMVALVISGLVALLAYSAITAGLDTLDRVETHRRETQQRALARPLISDALRHIADASENASTVFQITPGRGPGNGSLVFLTRGIDAPLGASGLWRMTLSASQDGLSVDAVPLEDAARSEIRSMIPGVREMRVRFLPTQEDQLWVTNWEASRQHPYAVKIEMIDSLGRIMDTPLVVATSFQAGR